jgi:predicted small lipoprotein YifL
MSRHALMLAALLLIFFVAGCGQSGPLFLPGNPSQIRTNPPEPQESEEAKDQDSETDAG